MKDVVLGQQRGLIRQQELEQVDERCAQSRGAHVNEITQQRRRQAISRRLYQGV